jgi:hypothetical protein
LFAQIKSWCTVPTYFYLSILASVLKLGTEEEAGHCVKLNIAKAEKLESLDMHGHFLGVIDSMLKGKSSLDTRA